MNGHCRACGQPLPKLLDQFPDEDDQAYAKRLRKEYRRETLPRSAWPSRSRRRSSAESEDELIQETYAILGVR